MGAAKTFVYVVYRADRHIIPEERKLDSVWREHKKAVAYIEEKLGMKRDRIPDGVRGHFCRKNVEPDDDYTFAVDNRVLEEAWLEKVELNENTPIYISKGDE